MTRKPTSVHTEQNPLREIFDLLDVPKSGVLSQSDFIRGLRYSGVVVDEDAISTISTGKFDFESFSKFADSALTVQRSESWDTQLESSFRALGKAVVAKPSNQLTVDEFEKLVTSLGPNPLPQCERLHDMLSSNKTVSSITYSDFKKLSYLS